MKETYGFARATRNDTGRRIQGISLSAFGMPEQTEQSFLGWIHAKEPSLRSELCDSRLPAGPLFCEFGSG